MWDSSLQEAKHTKEKCQDSLASGPADKPTPYLKLCMTALILFIYLSISPFAISQAVAAPRILVLNSYHKGFPWTDNVVSGIESVLVREKMGADLVIEYMDSKAVKYDETYKTMLSKLYSHKYGSQKFDVIISSDDNAFNFLREYRKEIFPDTPIVFCGVNNLEAPTLISREHFTGILEISAEKETMDLAFKLHPETKQVVIATDSTPSGKYRWKQLEPLFIQYPDITFTPIDDRFSISEIENRMKTLSDDTIAFFMSLYRDKTGRYISLPEGASRISKSSRRPIYTFHTQILQYGTIGGKLLGGQNHGKKSAEMALRIIQGEKVSNIPIIDQSIAQYIFDNQQLERFGIKSSDLPEESIIVNIPFSFYGEYMITIWATIVVFCVLTVIIIILNLNITKLRRVEKTLRESQHLLDTRARISSAFLTVSDEALFGDVLDIVLSMMQSEFGVFGYIDEQGDLLVPSMTRLVWDDCRVPEKDIRFPHDTWGDSLWCRAIREKRTFHSNQPSTKVPAGHIPMHRHLAVPIVYQSEVIGLLQVANKETDYDAGDIDVLETISDVIAPILRTRLQRDREERLRIAAEGAEKEAEKRYREIFEGTSEGIVVADLESRRFKYCNPAICEMLGYAEEELIELDVTDIHTKESRSHVLAEFEAQTGGDKPLAQSIPCLRKDGSVIYADVHATPAVIDGRECNVGFYTDVTEHRKMEIQFRQAQKMEAIGTLAGGIAHDFNNILSSVIGFTELSLNEVKKGTQIEDNLQEVYTAGKRAKDLVGHILAFARQSEEELKPIQVDTIAAEVLKFIRSSIPTTIEIRQNIESDSLIMGNATQVHQILMNLFTNAAHAMQDKGGILELSLKDVVMDRDVNREKLDLQPGNYIEITVSDTGAGIAPEIIGSIFDPYFTTKGPGEGTGMGLATVHGIIESYDGKISVASKPGQGTMFTIYLPITRKRHEHRPYQSDELPSGTERILFVDDEASIAKMGGQILERLGYIVSIRTCSIEALELFRAKPNDFDLVITDVTMPNMTGDKLAIELMKTRPDIPVILCTGYSKAISEDFAAQIGIKAFANKPVVIADFSKTVRKVLDDQPQEQTTGRILLIDDESAIRKLFIKNLAGSGYEIIEACDGKEGLKLYHENRPDLVITDLVMPEKEGIDTIIELKREFPDVKIIAISGGGRNDPDAYLQVAKTFGVERTFAKPIDWPELIEAIKEILG